MSLLDDEPEAGLRTSEILRSLGYRRRFGLFGGAYDAFMAQRPAEPATPGADNGPGSRSPSAGPGPGSRPRRPLSPPPAAPATPAAGPKEAVTLPELVVYGRRPQHWYDPLVRAASGVEDAIEREWRNIFGETSMSRPQPAASGAAAVEPPAAPGPTPGPDIGALSARYESGGRGAAAVSTGHGDPGGVSYGAYQLAGKTGAVDAFLKREGAPWSDRFGGATPGSPAFSQAWRSVAAAEPDAFRQAQDAYAKRTYFDAQAARIRKATGIDVSARSPAVQAAVFSTAIQHGQNTGMIARAIGGLSGPGGASPSDRQIIQAIYAERGRRAADGTLVHFHSSSAKVQHGVAARLAAEQADALAMLGASGARQTN